ncbi:MAG: putative dTDP-4-dehydrorhamnose reductase [Verrucomicrobia bacterium]|nr:putative dTDP-4-dehydrorhamnose reductase [Verrucomicrobiota bacterium]
MAEAANHPERVWVTGANGLIGSHLIHLAKSSVPAWQVVPIVRAAFDLTDSRAVVTAFQKERPKLIIHCAALSRSPECQANPKLAHEINVEVTKFLADLATDISFIFFSTDLVFNGQQGNYVETDKPNPLSVYAETKVMAERHVLRNPHHTVIRTSLNAGPSLQGDRGMDEQMLSALREGKALNLFTDEFRTPIPAEETARAVWQLAQQKAKGVYHVAGAERLSRWQIGELMCERYPQYRSQIHATSLSTYQGAPRSPDTSLNCAKAQAKLPFVLPKFSEWWRQRAKSEL